MAGKLKIILIVIAIIGFISLLPFITNILGGTNTWIGYFTKFATNSLTLIKTLPGAIYDLFIGLFAGIYLWIITKGIKLYRTITLKNNTNKNYEEISETKSKWLLTIADTIWKIPAIAIFFMIINLIPVVKTIVYYLMFSFFFTGFFSKSFIFAFYIGILPSILENFWKFRHMAKLQNKVRDAEKAGQITSIQSKMISRSLDKV